MSICAALLCGGCGQVTSDDIPGEGASEPGDPAPPAAKDGALGRACQPLKELDPEFEGFRLNEVSVDQWTPACLSGVCVIQGFQGRVSCAYGQDFATGGCTVPGSQEPVLTAVLPQLLERPPQVGAVCSCHCAGPGPGPYCDCPSNMECSHVVDDLGFGARDLAGSYCLPKGAALSERASVNLSAVCRTELQNCEP